MDTTTLVDRDIQLGRRLLDRLASESFPVRAACWVKEQNRFKPALFIATPLVDETGFTEAHRALHPILQSLDGGVWFQNASARLVGVAHPLVRDVQALRAQYPEGFLPADISMFGRMPVDEVYVYPPSEAFPGFDQIKQRYPSAELFTVNLPGEPLSPSEVFDPKQTPLLSKVNASAFEGKAPETLLFIGADASPEDKLKRLAFAYRPEGWNTMFDGRTQQWRRVLVAETSRPLYEPADFSPLAELKAQPVAAGA